MDKAKMMITEYKERVLKQLSEGFEMADIPEIAVMLDGIATIEACIARYWGGETPTPEEIDDATWPFKRAENELYAAQLYYDKWLATKDPDYLQIVRDELSHAKKFILEAKQHVTTRQQNEFLDKMHSWYERLQGKSESEMA